VRDQVRRSIDVVVHVARSDGRRRITAVAEVAIDADAPAVRLLVHDDHVSGQLARRRA
jgi:hypothetical protein